MKIPAKFIKRVNEQIGKYQTILKKLKKEEVNETDTVKVINDILSDVLGYDKYTEITSEYAIRNSYCDLAIKSPNDKIYMLIEVKAVTIPLKDNHIKQAVDYGVNQGVNWVILTNAVEWKIFRIKYSKPVERELVFEFNLSDFNIKNEKQLEVLFVISKEGKDNSVIEDLYLKNRIKNKYIIAGLINNPETYKTIKKLIKVYFENKVKITDEDIASFIQNDIFKREVWDSDEAAEYKKQLKRAIKKAEQRKTIKDSK